MLMSNEPITLGFHRMAKYWVIFGIENGLPLLKTEIIKYNMHIIAILQSSLDNFVGPNCKHPKTSYIMENSAWTQL